MPSPSMAAIVKAKELAAAGVDFSPQFGALCPWCGKKSRIFKTMPWEESIRVRYHRCEQKGCVLASLKTTVKSIQLDIKN